MNDYAQWDRNRDRVHQYIRKTMDLHSRLRAMSGATRHQKQRREQVRAELASRLERILLNVKKWPAWHYEGIGFIEADPHRFSEMFNDAAIFSFN